MVKHINYFISHFKTESYDFLQGIQQVKEIFERLAKVIIYQQKHLYSFMMLQMKKRFI